MKKLVLVMTLLFGVLGTSMLFAETVDAETAQNTAKAAQYLAAAIAIAVATFASGLAIGKIGSSAMGALSERPEVGGMALVITALAEGVSLWGFLIAFFILQAK
ncbi:MAG: ATPase [Spirochaetales bacterium]|nr:ATPase [Spirochaetales bacterium]